MMLYFITALSDTSFMRGVDHKEFSLDEGDDDVDTTTGLLSSARQLLQLRRNLVLEIRQSTSLTLTNGRRI